MGRASRKVSEVMKQAAIPSPWLTVKEAAVYLRVGPRFIYNEINAGRMRAARLGGRGCIVTRVGWLDEFVMERAKPIEIRKP